MAIAVDSTATVKLIDNVLSLREETVRNDGPNPVTISKDPGVVVGGATAWALAANGLQDVTLAPGEALYAVCATGQTASLEII